MLGGEQYVCICRKAVATDHGGDDTYSKAMNGRMDRGTVADLFMVIEADNHYSTHGVASCFHEVLSRTVLAVHTKTWTPFDHAK